MGYLLLLYNSGSKEMVYDMNLYFMSTTNQKQDLATYGRSPYQVFMNYCSFSVASADT